MKLKQEKENHTKTHYNHMFIITGDKEKSFIVAGEKKHTLCTENQR